MDAVALSRWQFGITTVYHYFFVPITIAMSMLVAVFQTFWVRTGNEQYLRLTKFFGKLFLINFAMGVVTGIVQEFQFGMNWSEYSRFVGDVFGGVCRSAIGFRVLGRLRFAFGLGIVGKVAKHATVGVSYTGAWGSDVDSHGIMGNLRINF